MDTIRALTPEELARAEERLRFPAPGSRIEAALRYGVDLWEVLENLALSPMERLEKAEARSEEMRRSGERPQRDPVGELLELEAMLEMKQDDEAGRFRIV